MIGFSELQRLKVYSIVAAVLHLGNIQFKNAEKYDGAEIIDSSEKSLQTASKLLAVDAIILKQIVLERIIKISSDGKNSDVIR